MIFSISILKTKFSGQVFTLLTLTFVFLCYVNCKSGFTGTTGNVVNHCATDTSTNSSIVITKNGPVQGTVNSTSLAFLGIPYAKPPVGNLRWKPPESLECSEVTLNATSFESACIQKSPSGVVSGSEDCLRLNLWKPLNGESSKAVMVFIHGGGNMTGSPSEDNSGIKLYDGQMLAERGDVIVITLNYRLNIFGYFMYSELEQESSNGVSGNYGILDQIAALKWIKDNVAAFGGDPSRVLLFGESGGATDVCGLLASPLAAGLFSSAIIQSGSCLGKTKSAVESWSQAFIASTSCSSSVNKLDCLRGLSETDIVSAMNSTVTEGGIIQTPAGPTVDGYVLPQMPNVAFAEGSHNKVPVIIGVNADETALPLFNVPTLTAGEYVVAINLLFGTTVGAQVLSRYPSANFLSPRLAYIAMTTDSQFVCPARQSALALDQGQTQPVYRYLYTHLMSGSAFFLGAAHGLELFYVFQTMSRLPSYTPSTGDLALEEHVLGYWTQMAKTGSPNGLGSPIWPEFSSVNDDYLNLRDSPVGGLGVLTSHCDFWDTL